MIIDHMEPIKFYCLLSNSDQNWGGGGGLHIPNWDRAFRFLARFARVRIEDSSRNRSNRTCAQRHSKNCQLHCYFFITRKIKIGNFWNCAQRHSKNCLLHEKFIGNWRFLEQKSFYIFLGGILMFHDIIFIFFIIDFYFLFFGQKKEMD